MKKSIIVPLLVLGMTLQISACQSIEVSSETETTSSVSESTEDTTITTETSESETSAAFTEVVDGFNYVIVYHFEKGKDKTVTQELFYDSNHNEIKVITNDSQGRNYMVEEYEYDDRGNKVKYIENMRSGSADYTFISEYEYDKDNNLIKTSVFILGKDGSSVPVNTLVNSYDSRGNLISTVTKADDGTITHRDEYEYDDAGRKTKYSEYEAEYKGKEELVNTTEYEYDQSGNMIKSTKFRPSGSAETRVEYEYDSRGNKIKRVIYGIYANGKEDIVDWNNYEYDSNNNLIKESRFIQEKNQTVPIADRTYDDKNNPLKVSYYEWNDEIVSWDEYHYEKK
jgi:hypothetical protein